MPFDFNALKDILRCPKSKSELVLDGNSLVSVDPDCRLRYEIRDGIPSMFPEDAATLSVQEWSAVMAAHGRDPVSGKPNVNQ
ncbi:MAG: hypothetical protein WD648_12490 [Planctomycetaceae bacterium]